MTIPSTTDVFRAAAGCDKATAHTYGPVYDALFPQGMRAAVRAILCLGVHDWGSPAALAEVFPNAIVVSLDQTPRKEVRDPRLQYRWLSPSAAETKTQILAEFGEIRFDLIIDDDTHAWADQLRGYDLWRDRLSNSGVYMIEDLQPGWRWEQLRQRELELVDLRAFQCRFDDVLAIFGPADAVDRALAIVPPANHTPPRVVYHAACMNHWREIIREQAEFAALRGLKNWDVAILGPPEEREDCRELLRECGVTATVHHESARLEEFEFPAIRLVEQLARKEDSPILYWHSKGASKPGDQNATHWRKCMTMAVVGLWPHNMARVDEVDMIGVNWLQNHFVGNFWLARPQYLRTLRGFDDWNSHQRLTQPRVAAEFWPGHGNPAVRSLVCQNQSHYSGYFQWLCGHIAEWFDQVRSADRAPAAVDE